MEHWLERAALMHPDREAIAGIGYADLLERARSVGGTLAQRGVAPGDRVALALPAGAEFAAALHGCFLAGVVAVPIDLRLGPGERAARRAGAVTVIDEPGWLEASGRHPCAGTTLALDAIATVMHTSGTTAAPRPVPLSFSNWLANALGSAVALGLDSQERWLCPMPLAHVGGLSILIRSGIYGTTVVAHERFKTETVLGELMDPGRRITLVSLVPTMLVRLLDAGLREPPALRWALLGGAPIPDRLRQRAADAGVPVASTYGMTEACSQIATHGWPLIGVSVSITADGEVLVRGPMVAQAALGPDGWLHTGDLGALDSRGRLGIVGRLSDTVITGGENVAPAEVERVLLGHPSVADAAVFGRSDPEWGEAVIAAVVARDGVALDAGALRSFCAARLAGFKVPKAFEQVETLPRGETGKLLRRELR